MQVVQPDFIPQPFASEGTAATIPDTKENFGQASWAEGFPDETGLPLSAGGIPPTRGDMNGILKALSEHIVWLQGGNVYTWNEDQDYAINARVQGSDGNMYMALAMSGPNVTGVGPKDPTTDNSMVYWKEYGAIFSDFVIATDFGAVGDFNYTTKTGTDNQAAIQKAIEYAASVNKPLYIPAGNYGVWNNGSASTINKTASAYNGNKSGGLDLVDGSILVFDDNAWLIQMHPTATGAFLANSNTGIFHPDAPDYASSNITLINPHIDGSCLSLWDTTEVNLENEWCNENAIGISSYGANLDFNRAIASNIKIVGGYLKGYLAMRHGPGGRGIGIEKGVEKFFCADAIIEDCTFATSVVYEYESSTFPRFARNICFENITTRKCGISFFCQGYTSTGSSLIEIPIDPSISSVSWKGTAWCCGHHPDFFDHETTAEPKRKGGVVVLSGCANVDVDIVVDNPNLYPSATFPAGGTRYPTSYPTDPVGVPWRYYGSGFPNNVDGTTGHIGAVLCGWGKCCSVDAVYNGAVGSGWQLLRPLELPISNNQSGVIDAKDMSLDINISVCNYLINNETKNSDDETVGYALSVDGNFIFTSNDLTHQVLITPSATPFAGSQMRVKYRRSSDNQWVEYSGYPVRRDGSNPPFIYEDLAKTLFRGLAAYDMYAYSLDVRNIGVNSVIGNANVNIVSGMISKAIKPDTTNAYALGTAANKWTEVFATTATINTSDEREKTNITDVNEALMCAWGKVGFKVFQFKDAFEKKGANARMHVGVIAQQVIEAFRSEGLDATKYGLLCYDKWEDEYEDVEVVDKQAEYDNEGNEFSPEERHTEKVLVTPAGDAYGIRYEEALALECAYQRWRLEQIEAKLNG